MGEKWAWDLDLSLFTSPLSIKFIHRFIQSQLLFLFVCQNVRADLMI